MNDGVNAQEIQNHLVRIMNEAPEKAEYFANLIPHAIVLSNYRPTLQLLMNQSDEILSDMQFFDTLSNAYDIEYANAVERINGVLWLVSTFGAIQISLALLLMVRSFRYRNLKMLQSQKEAKRLRIALEERDKFSHQASTDPLTNAYNRRAFWTLCIDSLRDNLDTKEFAVLVIDMDRFKMLNDSYGHKLGDSVLIESVKRIRNTIDQNSLVARIGGDEFAVLVSAASLPKLHILVDEIYIQLQADAKFDEVTFQLSASVGAVIVEDINNRTLDDILSDADFAMYAGRQSKTKKPIWYHEDMRIESEALNTLSHDLAAAIESDTLDQVFQPIINLATGDIAAFEVLVRWQHPEHGAISPEKIINVALNNGLLPSLDRLILNAALDALHEFHQIAPNTSMQVNLTGPSITPDLPHFVNNLLDERGIQPEFLTLELTETCIFENLEEIAATMNELVKLGINVHLDDFGTGFSSLSHLQSFPVNGIKIAKSFVSGAINDKKSRQLVDVSMAIAKSMQLEVVAEGIETEEQAQYVIDIGCEFGQGYWYSKPILKVDAAEMLTQLTKNAA